MERTNIIAGAINKYHCKEGGGFPGSSDGKSVCLQCGRLRFNPWVGKIPWRRRWQPTPVLLPGKSHGWRSLVGSSPWSRKELDMTERLHFHFSLFTFMRWRRKWQPTPVFMPGKSHGPRSLVGYSPWGRKESDTTERLLFFSTNFWIS